MFVKPGEGRRVRDPMTRLPVLDAGQEWPDHDTNLPVLLRHDDLVEADRPQAPADAGSATDMGESDAPAASTHGEEA